MGPLAEIAQDAGWRVSGSDMRDSLVTRELGERGIDVVLEQTYESISAEHMADPIDWFVYTSALPADHPELRFARENGLRMSKRDEFLNEFLTEKGLKMLAVAGTHGKTTTTGMLVWAFHKLNIPVSYSLGSTISFGATGKYDPKSEYFIYECDEYDRNFLAFSPALSIIPAIDYDHPDTYPTKNDYQKAFWQFFDQSDDILIWEKDYRWLELTQNENMTIYNKKVGFDEIALVGQFMRDNAFLAAESIKQLFDLSHEEIYPVLADFPGTARRFEKLKDGLYSDYAHHPVEIKATLEKALEINPQVVVVYQPHQNVRQHEVRDDYNDTFQCVKKLYWVPTFLTREKDGLAILTPEDLISGLANKQVAMAAELNDELIVAVDKHLREGDLVLVMGAGPVDNWARENLI